MDTGTSQAMDDNSNLPSSLPVQRDPKVVGHYFRKSNNNIMSAMSKEDANPLSESTEGKPHLVCIPNPFSESTPMTDLVLLVEDRRLYVNRAVLSVASPVFEVMLTGDYKEKDMQEIPLPGKQYKDVLLFLRCIYPSVLEQISHVNLDRVLPLADEYQVLPLKQRCEAYMLKWMRRRNHSHSQQFNKLLHFLYLADNYQLTNKLQTVCIDSLKCRSLNTAIEHGPNGHNENYKVFGQLSKDLQIELLTERLILLERYAEKASINGQCQELKLMCYK